MNNAEFQLQALGDPRLAVHATSALPAWLWSTDGTRILWANPVGARMFGAANSSELAKGIFGPADQHRRQVAQLAGRLLPNGAVRLERLQGFGAAPGMLATCGCSRLDFPMAATAFSSRPPNRWPHHAAGRTAATSGRRPRDAGRGVSLDGQLIGASDAARPLLGFQNLSSRPVSTRPATRR